MKGRAAYMIFITIFVLFHCSPTMMDELSLTAVNSSTPSQVGNDVDLLLDRYTLDGANDIVHDTNLHSQVQDNSFTLEDESSNDQNSTSTFTALSGKMSLCCMVVMFIIAVYLAFCCCSGK